MLLKVECESLTYSLLYGTGHLTVTKLCLGLTLKLRLCNLDRYYCGKTLAEILTLNLNLGFLKELVVIGVLLKGTCQCGAETYQMGTALYGVDVVYE